VHGRPGARVDTHRRDRRRGHGAHGNHEPLARLTGRHAPDGPRLLPPGDFGGHENRSTWYRGSGGYATVTLSAFGRALLLAEIGKSDEKDSA